MMMMMIINQRCAKTVVPREKSPDLRVQKLASRTTAVRDPVFKSQHS